MTEETVVTGQTHRAWRILRIVIAVGLALAVSVAAFVAVTADTGFPGPGPLRRYRTIDLEALARKIDQNWEAVPGSSLMPGTKVTNLATVEGLRSRVVVHKPICLEEGLLTAREQAKLERPIPFCVSLNNQ